MARGKLHGSELVRELERSGSCRQPEPVLSAEHANVLAQGLPVRGPLQVVEAGILRLFRGKLGLQLTDPLPQPIVRWRRRGGRLGRRLPAVERPHVSGKPVLASTNIEDHQRTEAGEHAETDNGDT
ncbi:hypothetical protein [Ruania albidiflava]|uniref:hypothetical protein n=1 Tax=Ruania albidiflava TaxID=366586 RepID=UPI00146A80EB|nr:hypothetical protein [Ruania albidiflava]